MPLSVDDLFPQIERVVYQRAPLQQVLCQLRFPTILRISEAPPAAFQDRIRDRFPLLEQTTLVLGPAQPQLPQEIMQLLGNDGGTYQFLTEDRQWTVTLRPDSLALASTKYLSWEDFRDRLSGPLQALIDIYKPSFFGRVGLRYVNAIDKNALGIEVPWSDLLTRDVLGELFIRAFEDNLALANTTLRIDMPADNGALMMRHGIGVMQGNLARAFVVDIDVFNDQKTEVNDVWNRLDRFNIIAWRAFRWCITPELHARLEPQPLSGVVVESV